MARTRHAKTKKTNGLSGRALFMMDATLFEDDDEADAVTYKKTYGGGGGDGEGEGGDEAAAAAEEEEAPEEPPPPPTGMDAVREALRRFRLPELGNKFESAGYDKLSDLVTLARTKAGAAATLQGDIGIKEAHAVKLVRWLRAPPAGRAIDDLMGE